VVEDVVYIGLGLLLAGCSLALVVSGLINFGQNLIAGSLTTNIVALLDRVLLILLVVELLYTVQVSFREHALMPEPFLLIGLIAGIRRVRCLQIFCTLGLRRRHGFPCELMINGPASFTAARRPSSLRSLTSQSR
jgi:Phosphate-starvation-inducible E family